MVALLFMTITQQTEAWTRIKATQRPITTVKVEFNRLLDYWEAKISAPYTTTVARRTSRNKATAKGQVGLKLFGIPSAQVGIERVFVEKK